MSKGQKPEVSFRIDEDEPILVKAHIVDISEGEIVYQVSEKSISNDEYSFKWEDVNQARNGVYLIEIFIKKSNDSDFKILAKERIVIVK